MENMENFMVTRIATPGRPLLGQTVLVVEDSRFSSEAMRLLCLRSGARIRRAGSIAQAHQHLKVYRPGVVIIDLGLPDGPGEGLIARLAAGVPRVDVLLGTSGDADGAARVMAAGADGFLPKPVTSLRDFRQAVLAHLRSPVPIAPLTEGDEDRIAPDPIAYRDDLAHVADVLSRTESGIESGIELDYLAQFLGGVARSAQDLDLDAAVSALTDCRSRGQPLRSEIARLAALVQSRLSAPGQVWPAAPAGAGELGNSHQGL